MLSQLKAIFDTQYKKQKCKVKDIESSCCDTITTEVFYFDQITEKFMKGMKVGNILCSVDVIHFILSKNELLLAELTSFKKYAATTGKNTDLDCLNYIRNELLDNKFRNKIIHSIFTIVKIADYYKLNKAFYTHFFDTQKILIKNYLVIDLTPEQYIFIEISCIDKLEGHRKNRIEGQIYILDCEEFEKRLVG